VNVLYVSHTAEVSGGERSLLGLLEALPTDVNPLLATPAGDLQAEAKRIGVPTQTIAGTAGSLRLHPLHTPQALAEMAFAARQVRRIAHHHAADVVHANSIRAGIVLGLGRPAAPTVVHVRDCLPPGAAARATLRLIARTATRVVANSAYTGDAMRVMAPAVHVTVVHSAVDLSRFDPSRIDRAAVRAGLGAAGGRHPLLGVVAQLSPWKGQETAVEALRLLRDEGSDAHLLLIGSAKFVARATRFDNEAYVARLRERIAAVGLEDRVSWLGERDDVPELMRGLDVLLLPSSEEPFGRVLVEAMSLEVPVLATTVGGPREIVRDGREGYLLEPGDPAAWAHAAARITADPQLAERLGRAGRERALAAFGLERHVAAMIALYREIAP
jgi:glycosyltransferase involved in cell wall biosynthesis